MKKLLGVLSVCVMSLIYIAPVSADWGAGVTLHVGEYETDGSETEATVSGITSEVTNHSEKEGFYGASVYVEKELANGFVVGLDWVPMDVSLGARSRDDAAANTDTGNDSGARKAEAELSNLFTLYANVPFGPGYVLLGIHQVDVNTIETLPTSSYGNETIQGYQLGYGFTNGTASIEAFYSDFEDISITGTGSAPAQNKVDADADTIGLKLKLAFGGF